MDREKKSCIDICCMETVVLTNVFSRKVLHEKENSGEPKKERKVQVNVKL